jgi:predicted ArsR family transcriptional regulator
MPLGTLGAHGARKGHVEAILVTATSTLRVIQEAQVPLDRDIFLRSLLRELAGTLEDVVGLKDAAGYISVVGQKIGDQINNEYRSALQTPILSREQVAEVLVDLKRRIQGDFYVVAQDEDKIAFRNRACPFGEMVSNRPSMCMMTSNVFGAIAAENLGYAKVELQETIAQGAAECMVVVHLKQTVQSEAVTGREYFQNWHK